MHIKNIDKILVYYEFNNDNVYGRSTFSQLIVNLYPLGAGARYPPNLWSLSCSVLLYFCARALSTSFFFML